MRNVFLPLVIGLGLLLSCSDNEENIPVVGKTAKTINIPEVKLNLTTNNERLVFKNQASFDATVRILESYEAPKLVGNTASVKEVSMKEHGFVSLADDFENAMGEAEKYCDTEAGYKEFKQRHTALFFAEQPDDYSAYLPVKNKTVAKLLNAKGEVEIAGEVKDLRDITSYSQLKELDRVPVESQMQMRGVKAVNKLDEVRCNNRKLWVKTRIDPGNSGVGYWAIIEVCFRKKGFLGAWYNYKSDTTLGWKNGKVIDNKSGFSSHDYPLAMPQVNAGFVKGTMWVQFRGFGAECGGNKYEFDVNL